MDDNRKSLGPLLDTTTGEVRYTSVSQIQTFDADGTYGGCNRRWYYDKIMRLGGEDTQAQETGRDVHRQIEHYLKTGVDTLGIIARSGKRFMPSPGSDLMIEHEFGDHATVHAMDAVRLAEANQATERDRQMLALARERLRDLMRHKLIVAGLPVVGYIDVVHRRGVWVHDDGHVLEDSPTTAEVIDWKTSSNIDAFGKKAHELPGTVQMNGYGFWASERWPDLTHVRLSHGYMQTRGRKSEKRSVLVPVDRLRDSWQRVVGLVGAMQEVAKETDPLKVEANHASCSAYRGCPHRALCPRSKEQVIMDTFGGKGMSLLARLKATTGTGSPTPEPPKDTPKPAETKPETSIKDEKARLLAEEKEPPRGTCEADGTVLTVENSSKLPSGEVVHTDKDCAARVVPPDAPKSAPSVLARTVIALRREGATDEEILRVKAAIDAHAAAAQGSADAHAEVASVAAKGASANNATPPEKKGARTSRKKTEGTPEPHPASPEDIARDRAFIEAQSKSVPQSIMSPSGVNLFVDCVAFAGCTPESLDWYVDKVCSALAAEFNAADIRCAPSDTPLGFGKWKGALHAAVIAAPPPAGWYTLLFTATDERKQVVAEALRSIATVYVRGI